MGRKIVGLVLIASGIFFTARGVWYWAEAPLPPNRSVNSVNMYVMSRQVEDLAGGVLAIAMGVLIYRRGLKILE